MEISKLEAARRQFETAIILYFNEDDPISIHTLTAASYNVIRDINNKVRCTPMMAKDMFSDSDCKDRRNEFMKKINEAENFLKHANRDTNDVLVFNPDLTEFLLLDVCLKYKEITGEKPVKAKIFKLWLIMKIPEIFNPPEEMKDQLNKMRKLVLNENRKKFFKKKVALFKKIKS